MLEASELLKAGYQNFEELSLDEQYQWGEEFDAHRIQSLKVFRDEFHPKTDLVYYPFSSDDYTPAEVFTDSELIHLDQNLVAINQLRSRGISNVVWSHVLDYEPPETPDVLLNYGPEGVFDGEVGEHLWPFVKPGGFIVTNSLLNAGYFTCFHKNELELVGHVGLEGDVARAQDTGSVSGGFRYMNDLLQAPEGQVGFTKFQVLREMLPGYQELSSFIIRRAFTAAGSE